MKAFRFLPALAASALLIAGSGAMAANYGSSTTTTAPPASAKPATPAPAKHSMVRSPESIQCSKEADTRGLHGKERVKFRAACKTALRHHQPIPEVKS